MRFELHCHSTCSDGTEPPARVAARAAERGVEVFALTDHDTCAGSALTVDGTAPPFGGAAGRGAPTVDGTAPPFGGAAGRGAPTVAAVRVIRAVELSCDDDGRTVHVLAFDRAGGAAWAALEARLEAVREARRNRLRVMAARLAHRGITIDVEALVGEADRRSIGRPDLARAMVAAGAASSMKDAFARHLYDGGPVDVPHRALPLREAIELGQAAGAALSLAHPHLYDQRSAHYLRRYQASGLTGIEAYYGAYDPRERGRWIALADQLGLTCTGGSDWHGPEAPNAQPGVDLPDDRSAALLAWLG